MIFETMKAEIERAIGELVGKELWKFTRAVNMAMFQFGERREIVDAFARKKEVGELALHVQCAWRITEQERVLVGSRDLRYPADYREEEIVSEEFDWSESPNRLDKRIDLFFERKGNLLVESVNVGLAGSFCLPLTGGISLEVFPDNSLALEHWRLFRPGAKGRHFVLSGGGIET
jgi:hypothetical protein